MPVVKIKELPVKSYAELKPTDLMIVEDTADTKQITLQDLKLFFSSDDKLEAIIDQMTSSFRDLQNYIDNYIQSIKDVDSVVLNRLDNLFNDHELTKQRLGKIQEDLVDAQNDISNINNIISTHNTQISDLQNSITDHNTRLQNLERDNTENRTNIVSLLKDNGTNKAQISKLQKDLQSLTTLVNQEMSSLQTQISTVNIENHKYTDESYDRLMKYIDYYHHVHENPPNFDEPYKGDPVVASYIHPVGTIFETSDPNFEINKWFPGTWKFMGTGASVDEDGNRVVDYYTWIRVQ